MELRRKKLNIIKEKIRVEKALQKEEKKNNQEKDKNWACIGFEKFRTGGK